jgi:glycosyltransferase involved in cell wall biosynthesis
MSTPVLMITYNRLDYTKVALDALLDCRGAIVYIIDNASTDGTREWLREHPLKEVMNVTFNTRNVGIAGAMNQFLEMTASHYLVSKVDNDTVVAPDFLLRMRPHMKAADIVQAKHPILKATHPEGFDAWVSEMAASGSLRFNHFVGGSGILFKRNIVGKVPVTDWMLGGWRQWQRDNPEFRKAFALDVEIELLDTNDQGADYSKYPEYYKETQRL